MRCHYLSDLHLESQEFPWNLPTGEVLIVAGDVCHARCLKPVGHDRYAINQRDRVMRFFDQARARFGHVVVVAGNHEYYDGEFEAANRVLREQLPGVSVLDNDHVDIGGVRFIGTTLWTDFEGGSQACMDSVRRRMGDYFFIRKSPGEAVTGGAQKFQPEDAFAAHRVALEALSDCVSECAGRPIVIVTHHAPSLQGLNPIHQGNGLDGAYASDLGEWAAGLSNVRAWVHGHTHIQRRYRIAETPVYANCRGFDGRDASARGFSVDRTFEL